MLAYGVREFGMSAIMNGLALHCGFIPFGGTFLVFSDYARNAVRLAAMMHQRVIFLYSHDSIGLGEDGPTHQPVEHLAMLRATPGMEVWRPCDGVETAVAWREALQRQGPSSLILSRQTLPQQSRTEEQLLAVSNGAYILYEPEQTATALIIATGSEIHLAVAAAQQLGEQGLAVRVVSMPCVNRFLQQTAEYREQVLPSAIKARMVVEASVSMPWWAFVGEQGYVLGVDRFGLSAPYEAAYEAFGITIENIVRLMQGVAASVEKVGEKA